MANKALRHTLIACRLTMWIDVACNVVAGNQRRTASFLVVFSVMKFWRVVFESCERVREFTSRDPEELRRCFLGRREIWIDLFSLRPPGRFLTAFFIHAILFALSDDQLIKVRH